MTRKDKPLFNVTPVKVDKSGKVLVWTEDSFMSSATLGHAVDFAHDMKRAFMDECSIAYEDFGFPDLEPGDRLILISRWSDDPELQYYERPQVIGWVLP